MHKVRFLCVSLASLGCAWTAGAQVVAFEADQWPETAGWTRDQVFYQADRWLDSGWLVQSTEYGPEPGTGEEDWYRRSIGAFGGTGTFFVTWKLTTDGSRQAIPSGAPALITPYGFAGIGYHFTIARDRVRFIDPYLYSFYFEIAPDVPHVYRLEVRGRVWAFFIDGDLVNAGTATKNYPTSDSAILFGARAPLDGATTRWDYIRYGVIPDDAGAGDLNCDGTLNQFDIVPFVDALISPDGYGQAHPACNRMLADTNADGTVNQFDIVPFIDLLMP